MIYLYAADMEYIVPGGAVSLVGCHLWIIIPVMNEALMTALKLCLRSLAAGRNAAAATKCYFTLSCCIPFGMSLNCKTVGEQREIKRSFPKQH